MEESLGYQGINRQIASKNSGDAELLAMEQELGIVDSSGKSTVVDDEDGLPLDPKARKDSEDLSKYVGMSDEAQKAKPPEDPEKALKDKTDKAIKAVGGDVPLEENVLVAAASGVAKGLQNTYNFGVEVADWIENKIGKTNLIDASQDSVTIADSFFPKPEGPAAKMTQGIAQFMTLFVPGTGIVKGMSKAKDVGMVGSAVAGFASDVLAFKGNEGRISDALKEIPILGNFAISYLVSKPEDTELEGRFKNGIEGIGLGVAAEGFIKGMKYLKASKETTVALKTAQDIESGVIKEAPKTNAEKLDPNLTAKVDATPKEVVDKGAQAVIDEKAVKNFEARKRGVIPDSELDRVSVESGVKIDDLFNKKVGTAFNAEETNVLSRYHTAAQTDLELLAKDVTTDPTPEKLAKFEESLQAFSALDTLKSAGASENARALRLAQRQTSEVLADPNTVKEYLAMAGEGDIKKTAYMIANAPKKEISKIVEKSYKRKMSEAAAEVFRNNLLASPKTHAVNMASNAAFFGVNIAERLVAPVMGKGASKNVAKEELRSAFSARKTLMATDTSKMTYDGLIKHNKELAKVTDTIKKAQKSSIEFGEATQMLIGTVDGFMDGIRALKKTADIDGKTFKEMMEEARTGPSTSSFSEGSSYDPKISSDKLGGGKVVDILGGIQRLPGKGLAWADDFWKFVNYRSEVRAQAYRLGKKQGMFGEELAGFMQEFKNTPPDFVADQARQFAKVNTFQEELGPVAGTFNDLLNKIDDKIDLHVTGFVVPFRQAPVNIATQGFERTPLAIMGKRYKDAIAKGGADAQIERAKFALGSTFVAASSYMALQGHLTGGGPSDYKMRRQLEQTGWKPYSLKLETDDGTKYVELGKLEPIGSMLQLSADMVEVFSELGTDDPQYSRMALNTALATYNLMTPEMLTDTFGKLTDALSDPTEAGKFVARAASKTVPFIGYAKTVRTVTDQMARETNDQDADGTWSFLKTSMNEIRNQVPGLSKDLPTRKNIFGEDMPMATGFGKVLSPMASSHPKENDPVLKELVSLGYASDLDKNDLPEGEKHLVIDYPPKNIKVANGMVNLNSKEHSKFVELSAGIGLEQAPYPGQTLKEALKAVIDSDYSSLGRFKTDQNKRTLIKSVITSYRTSAKFQMIREFPEIEERLNKSRESYINARIGVEEAESAGDI